MNAQTGVKVDMIEAGIIDPTKVVRTAIVGAVRVSSLMLTTEAMVVDETKKEDKQNKQGFQLTIWVINNIFGWVISHRQLDRSILVALIDAFAAV